MPTIGTAGHVDHGKSALIQALCGKNPMHLPEELKREMTIDLGFAYFRDSQGNPVGIIDVPGHERFIRNMVAGMSSLDLVLFVIAADEGWMDMSEEHLRVIHALHMESLILVINKIDKVPGDEAELVREDAEENVQRILGRPLPVCEVSALSGQGIPELKQKILEELGKIPKEAEGAPFFFVDRIFSVSGRGLVTAGTLQGGALTLDSKLLQYPWGEPLRIKSIQSHASQVEKALPGSRVACNIKLGGKAELFRGDCLAAQGAPILTADNLLVKLNPDAGKGMKNHGEIELALGTAHALGKIHFLNEEQTVAQIALNKTISYIFGQYGVLIQPGGSALMGAFRALVPADKDRRARRKSLEILEAHPLETLQEFQLLKKGYCALENFKGQLPQDALTLEHYYLCRSSLDEISRNMHSLLQEESAGLTEKDLFGHFRNYPREIPAHVLSLLLEQGGVEFKENLYFLKGKKVSFSPLARQILGLAEAGGLKGLASREVTAPGSQKEFQNLCRMKKLVFLGDGLYYSRPVYEKVSRRIQEYFSGKEAFPIADARELTGLSRKYLLPVLNLMQEEKRLVREGDLRRIISP